MAKLILKLKDVPLEEVLINKSPITIGRDQDNDIVIDNLAISRHHAKIVQEGSRYLIEDLKSGNGTYINDRRVSTTILQHKDAILVGKHTLVFMNEEEMPVKKRESRSPSLAEETIIVHPKARQEPLGRHHPASEDKPAGFEGSITIISGGINQERIELTKRTTTAGKSRTADIKLRGFLVGNPAFIINKRSEGFFITHANGKRMTRVNGATVGGQHALQDGDIIMIGATKMQFFSQQQTN
jgi:pSer/pThr/pTyr-binding forkhead associated (FHA) protein